MRWQDVVDTMNRSLDLLHSTFRTGTDPDGRQTSGWYHYLDDVRPGVTASAAGLYCFHLCGKEFERATEVVDFLVRQQQTGSDHTNGGWAVRTTNGFPIVEATAWVVRALSLPAFGTLRAADSVSGGLEWLERNQNTDLGWGSYSGQPSRVFTTVLALLALREAGTHPEVLADGIKWLISAQDAGAPAWGPLPESRPTLLHTSFALQVLAKNPGSYSQHQVQRTTDWMLDRLQPGVHTEPDSTVEEYDVPFPSGKQPAFQNSLPHFAGPVAVATLTMVGANPLRLPIFDAVSGIIQTQRNQEPGVAHSGDWELPRSPQRPSIWAVWPFLAALAGFKNVAFPAPNSRIHLIFSGCAVVQTEDVEKDLTRRLLVTGWFSEGLRRHRWQLALWLIAMTIVLLSLGLLLIGRVNGIQFTLSLIIPALMVIFQIAWQSHTSNG